MDNMKFASLLLFDPSNKTNNVNLTTFSANITGSGTNFVMIFIVIFLSYFILQYFLAL